MLIKSTDNAGEFDNANQPRSVLVTVFSNQLNGCRQRISNIEINAINSYQGIYDYGK